MRKKRGKKTAVFLAAVLAFQTGFSTSTARAGSRGAGSAAEIEFESEFVPASGYAGSVLAGGTGEVDVSVAAALVLQKSVAFTVNLTGAQGSFTDTLTLGAAKMGEGRVRFEGIAPGSYELTLTAPGFAKFSQNIEIGEQGCEVKLATGFLGGFNYAQGALHPGVLLLGDVDGDGVIGEEDRTKLVDAIDAAGRGSAVSGIMDLNGDGVVDLVDLEYFVKSYAETGDTSASLETFVPASVIAAREGENTKVNGAVSGVLTGDFAVSLTPAFGGEISDVNPVSLEFDFASVEQAVHTDGILVETAGDNPIKDALVSVVYEENGTQQLQTIPITHGVSYLLRNSEVRTEQDKNGNIRIYLGTQIAVKKVTLTITGMQNNNNLAEISKVEFVNGMENRIPEPDMDIPQNVNAQAGSEKISLSWSACKNITGYEICIKQGSREETVFTTANSIDIKTFGGKELKNYTEYTLSVQSVNGTWRSGYGAAVTATPKPSKKPDKPDNVSAAGNYRSISVSWKQMKDTVTYNLYYKESTAGSYQVVQGLTTNSYMITDLKDLTEYTVYVTGVNEFGESAPSLPASAKTTDLQPPVIPRYHLINTGDEGEKGAHITSTKKRTVCKVTDSPLDTNTTSAWATVDRNPASYYETAGWDEGGYNALSSEAGLTYEFDQAYRMDTIAFYCYPGYDFFYAKVRYWDANGTAYTLSGVSVQTAQDEQNRSYRVIKLAQPVNAKKIQIGLGRYLADGKTIRVAEVYFYHYDTLMEEIMSLYEDDLHTVLRTDVTQATVDALREKINEIDEESGEYNPNRVVLERELKTAEDILNAVALKEPVQVHAGIMANDVGRGFSGLNAWQPLGVTAGANEKITIYVGHTSKKTGDSADLRLVATQYHSEANAVANTVVNLKVGANVVTIPRIGTLAGQENGGALYVEYTGKNAADRYAVRVNGGVSVPKLDLYQVTDESERLSRATAYINELQAYVSAMESNHNRFHKTSESSYLNSQEYDAKNCILGASDILLDQMMISLPASQLLAGTGSGTAQEKAQKLVDSMKAMEDMMYLFYQHKGLNAGAADAVDQLPKRHLNIRYQRMFSGAFMYASGNHIGIEWGSATGLVNAVPVTADEEGRYLSGRYFGWGIAHEIGHDINQGAYAVAEITNNYFAVLAQAKDTNGSVRFVYDNVYKKVTSNTKGKASNVFTQLAMYWQLHLAYDKGYNYKTYADYSEQLANLFFARVDTYARTPAKAPQPGGVALSLSGGTDQVLMRLACAAAQKDLLEFFERWGMTPDEGTKAYAGQFAKETRAIYYANDDARVYALTGAGSSLDAAGTTAAVSDVTTAVIRANTANQVNFTLGADTIPAGDVLGFEITRCMISGGQTQKQTIGFTTGSTFTDTISSINNRVVWYEVSVIDKYLNRSAAKVLEPLKIEHDGSVDKTFFTVSTKNLTVPGETEESKPADSETIYDIDFGEEGDYAEEAKSKENLIDHNTNTIYNASVGAGAEIVLEFNKTLAVTGLKYTAGGAAPSGSYEISLLCGGEWIKTAEGSFGTESVQTIYFANADNQYVATFEASAVKLCLSGMTGSTISIAELDVLGVTGDNVDFRRTDDSEGTAVIGTLAADYQYGTEADERIPAGSVIFTGRFKGNPAYNVVILYDQNGNMVGASDSGEMQVHQIILANVPDTGNIQDTADGTWIYWIMPEDKDILSGVTKVRAELYRVNDALTNEGQRMVSDSLFEAVPEGLPEITIDGGSQTASQLENELADEAEDQPENEGEDQPEEGLENEPEKQPEEGSENESGNEAENQPEDGSENESGNEAEKQPENDSESEPESQPEEGSGNEAENQPENDSESEPESQPEEGSGNESGNEVENRTENGSESEPESQPEEGAENESGNEAENRTENGSESEPGNESGDQPESQPEDSSVNESENEAEAQPENGSENESKNEGEAQPENGSENESKNEGEAQPEDGSENKSENEGENQPENGLENETKNQPGDGLENQPENDSENEPENQQ